MSLSTPIVGSPKRRVPRWLKGFFVGLSTGLTGVLLVSTSPGVYFEQNIGLAWLFNQRGAIEPTPNVAVVAINDRVSRTLDLPRLPRDWPRSIHAQLIEKLVDNGASVIVYDMDFQRPRDSRHDAEFGRAVAQAGNVVFFERLEGKRQPVLDLAGNRTATIWVEERIPPIPELATAARALAPFPVPKVQVNIFQFWTFKPSAVEAATLPAAALQVFALRVYDQWRELLVRVDPNLAASLPKQRSALDDADAVESLMRKMRQAFTNDPSLGTRLLQEFNATSRPGSADLDQRLITALIQLYQGQQNPHFNFYGPPGTIPTISFSTVIKAGGSGKTPELLNFTDKVVFVGFLDLLDPGQPDRFYTVFTRDDGVDLSGVEIAATGFANLLDNRVLSPAGTGTSIAILLSVGLVLGLCVFLLPVLAGVPLALLISGAYLYGAQWAFNTADIWLPIATPVLVQLPMALFIGLIAQYMFERHLEQVVSKALGYYLPENVAKEMMQSEVDPSSLDKAVYGACLATDMSGFTSISETMPPDKLAEFMNKYFGTLAMALNRYQVDVTEFHADTIMCAWTASDADSLARHKAALAGLAVVEAVERFNRGTSEVNLNARIGIEEGQFYLGHTGGGGRMGYSILGDCANTAARLESLNKHLGTHVLASESVVGNLQGFQLRPLGQFVLVGKHDPLSIVEVLSKAGSQDQRTIQLCDRFAEALQLFTELKWATAAEAFGATLTDFSQDGPSAFYMNLCNKYVVEPPEFSEPAVVHMDSK